MRVQILELRREVVETLVCFSHVLEDAVGCPSEANDWSLQRPNEIVFEMVWKDQLSLEVLVQVQTW